MSKQNELVFSSDRLRNEPAAVQVSKQADIPHIPISLDIPWARNSFQVTKLDMEIHAQSVVSGPICHAGFMRTCWIFTVKVHWRPKGLGRTHNLDVLILKMLMEPLRDAANDVHQGSDYMR